MNYLENIPLATSRKPPLDEPYLSIDDVCLIADNGDIILFSGESRFSGLVTFFCGSQWSHIGIVYKPKNSMPMLFESVKSDNDPTKEVGVRLLSLRDSLMNFRGKSMALRCLCIPEISMLRDPDIKKTWQEHLRSSMAKCVQEYRGKKYEDRLFNFIFARFTSISIDYETRGRLFCSELVAICYQTMCILDPRHSSIQFSPDDFCEAGDIPLSMPMCIDIHTLEIVNVKLGLQMFIRIENDEKSLQSDVSGSTLDDIDEEGDDDDDD